MSRRRWTSPETGGAALLALALGLAPERARAQACCAGTGALTPARLAGHEDALAGATVRAANAIGSYDDAGRHARSPAGTRELDFEQDLFGAVRVLRRGQLALLVPAKETERKARGPSETGGGLGDVNLSLRWDFLFAGHSRVIPGVALLAGVTAPTGRAADDAEKPLATDATGIGAWQLSLGVAFEQIYGPWALNLTGFADKRTSRSARGIETSLATRYTALAGAAYVFRDGVALAAYVSHAREGRAEVNGEPADGSSQRLTQLGLSAVVPFDDMRWRLRSSLFVDPPLDSLGKNLPAETGLSLTLIRAFF